MERGFGLAICRDDLALVGAQYYALGDIHEPQGIPGLEAWYPGSLYATDFGETHSPGCNLVAIEASPEGRGFTTVVTRIDFGRPANIRVRNAFGEIGDIPVSPGKRIWWEIRCTPQEAARLDTRALTQGLVESGAAPGSRVTVDLIPTETVRTTQITGVRSLKEKVRLWGEYSSLELCDSVLEKADMLEQSGASRGVRREDIEIRIDRLVLRGATGIWKRSRKDEILLDLESLPPGVVALVGRNGAGKTTIVENLHPWPRLLTRDGSLKSHFRLKDSCRDLYFTNLVDGMRYRALIELDGVSASGSPRLFLFVRTEGRYVPLPGISGRQDPYEEAVSGLFGSLALYLRTAFVTQRPARGSPDLAEASKGERKNLFVQLSGIEYLETYRELAREEAQKLAEKLRHLSTSIEFTANIHADRAVCEKQIAQFESTIAAARVNVASLESEYGARSLEVKRLQGLVHEAIRTEERIHAARASIASHLRGITQARSDAEGCRNALMHRDVCRGMVERAEALEVRVEGLKRTRDELLRVDQERLVLWQRERAAADQKRSLLQASVDAASCEAVRLEREAEAIADRITSPHAESCPTCGQGLPEDRRSALAAKRVSLQNTLAGVTAELFEARGSLEAARVVLVAHAGPGMPSPSVFCGEAELKKAEAELGRIDVRYERRRLAQAEEAEQGILRSRNSIAELEERVAAEGQALADLEALQADVPVRETLDRAEKDLGSTRVELDTWKARSIAACARRGDEVARMAELEKIARGREELVGERDRVMVQRDEWSLLELACGQEGIQALELDALAPGIAEIANRLLGSSGIEGRIEFHTTRLAGRGGRERQIEDFLIMYIDANGEEQEVSTLSGGESVWVRKAVYDAFGVVRARNSGIRFATVILDEADGALDPAARMRYLRMVEAAHREAGRHHTIMITHSTELQAMAGRCIDVEDLPARGASGERA